MTYRDFVTWAMTILRALGLTTRSPRHAIMLCGFLQSLNGRWGPALFVTTHDHKPARFLFWRNLVTELHERGPLVARDQFASVFVDVYAQLHLLTHVCYIGERLAGGIALGRFVCGIELLYKAEVGQVLHQVGIEGVEVVQHALGGARRHEPLGSCIVEILEDNVNADQRAGPFEAMQQVYWHGGQRLDARERRPTSVSTSRGADSFAEVRYGRKEDQVCLEGNLDRLGQSWTRREEKVAVGGTEPGSLE